MTPFWKSKKNDNQIEELTESVTGDAKLIKRVLDALGPQANEFDVNAIVHDLLVFDHVHEWNLWTAIHRHDRLPADSRLV